MPVYKGITFPDDFNMSFGDFKDSFSSIELFKNVPHKQRDEELKKAHKIAISKNGNTSGEIKKSKES